MQSLIGKFKKSKASPKKASGKAKAKKKVKVQGQPGLTSMLLRRFRLLGWKPKLALAMTPLVLVGGFSMTGTGQEVRNSITALPVTLSQELGLTVQNVVLNGRNREKRINVLSALGARRGDPILLINIDDARDRVERLGWVKSARIARRLPDTLEVFITEHEPFALWQKDGRFNVVSQTGEIADEDFESHSAKKVAYLPHVLGEGANNHVEGLMRLLANRPIVQNHFVAGRRMGNRRWDLILQGDVVVKLPESGIDSALVRLEALIGEQKVLEKAVASIDLRFRDRVIVKMTPEGLKAVKQAGLKA